MESSLNERLIVKCLSKAYLDQFFAEKWETFCSKFPPFYRKKFDTGYWLALAASLFAFSLAVDYLIQMLRQ